MQRNYKEILQAISFHKDFGKRNPIDIGIELGYSQQEVEEMIQIISEEIHKEEIFILKNDPEKNTNSQSDEDSSTYHFSYRDININSKEVRLYYDGKDINKRAADIIGLNESNVLFAELDDYLIYLDEEDC